MLGAVSAAEPLPRSQSLFVMPQMLHREPGTAATPKRLNQMAILLTNVLSRVGIHLFGTVYHCFDMTTCSFFCLPLLSVN